MKFAVGLISVLVSVAAAADGCEDGWTKYEDQCLFNSRTVRSYSSCESYCSDRGAGLPCIYDLAMQAHVGDLGTGRSPGLTVMIGYTNQDGWADPTCTSTFVRFPVGNAGAMGCYAVSSRFQQWTPVRCDANNGEVCVCQKQHPSEITLRGPCFDGFSDIDKSWCFPWKCGGRSEMGSECWDDSIAGSEFKHQRNSEFLLSMDRLTVDEHEGQAQEWGGHVASVHDSHEDNMLNGVVHGDRAFFQSENAMAYGECEQYCAYNNAQMLCITDAAMSDVINANFPRAWLGYTDVESEGTWRWSNPSCSSTFTNWADGQPNNFRGIEDCADNSFRFPFWNDNPCDAQFHCVCEVSMVCSDELLLGATRSHTPDTIGSNFVWNDRSEWNYENWSEGEPDDDSSKTAVLKSRVSGGKWKSTRNQTIGCGPYKRDKQHLMISDNINNTELLFVPGVTPMLRSLDASPTKHSNKAIGSYIVSSDHRKLTVKGTETVAYLVQYYLDFVQVGFFEIGGLAFGFAKSSGCLVKACFFGICQSMGERQDSVTDGVITFKDAGGLSGFGNNNYLVFQQFCDTQEQESTFANIQVNYKDCPSNSAVALAGDGKPFCKCDEGYLSSRFDIKKVALDDICTPVAELDMEAGATWLTARITIDDPERYEGVDHFLVEMHKQQGPSTRVEVHPGHGEKVSIEDLILPRVDGLEPGRWHHVSMIPHDSEGNPVVNLDASKSSILTHCSCSNLDGGEEEEDITGTPLELIIDQEGGFVTFSFRDDSMCEDSYAFTRQTGTTSNANSETKDSFTPNYFFYSRYPCARNRVRPGRQTSDNLHVSRLPVGEYFMYCIRAAAQNYMQNPEDPNEPSLASSNESCGQHRIHWEASIDGKVTLEKVAGSLPVKDVQINWDLLDPALQVLISGSMITGDGGGFRIVMNEELGLDNDVEYPVRIKMSKQTVSGNTTINHVFLCEDGAIECTEDGTIVHVRHLQFDEPVHIIDATSVQFTGKVVVGDTASEESGDGCPIIGAEVCLIDKNARGTDINELCETTDSFGRYSFPAVIGTRVTVEVRYYNHTFQPLDDTRINLYVQGILIEGDGVYENNDFKDVTTTDLYVDVAGGLCNHVLGTSTVQIAVSGGCNWRRSVTQGSSQSVYQLPAHVLDIQVIDMVDDTGRLNKIRDYFLGDAQIQTIDLRDMEAEAELEETLNTTEARVSGPELSIADSQIIQQEEDTQEEEALDLRRLRFQYNGELRLSIVVKPDNTNGDNTTCSIDQYPGEDSQAGCNSLHVVPWQTSITMELFLRYFLKDGLFCNIVNEDLETRVINYLGPSEADKENWFDYSELTDDEKALLNDCNDDSGGCRPPIIHDVDESTGAKSNARTGAMFLTGPPNVNGDFLRLVDFVVDEMTHKACFVITGDYTLDQAGSVALPTHEPILVLRDPPGGLSYASYENVHTTIRVISDSHEVYTGFDAGFGVGPVADVKLDACAGGGFGAIFLGCKGVQETYLKHEAKISGGADFLTSFGEDNLGATFTTSWSYQTSTDQWIAGHESDVFVVPNMDVLFMEVETISWDVDQCLASKETSFKFDIDSPSNKPAFSFYSVFHIENFLLPELDNIIEATQKDIDDPTTNTTMLDRLNKLIKDLQKGREGWNTALEDYRDTNEKAHNGDLANVPRDWFERFSIPIASGALGGLVISRDGIPLPKKDIWSSLIPLDLVDRAVKTGEGAPDRDSNRNELGGTNRIQFSGDGSTIGFSLNYHQMKEHVEKMGEPKANSKGRFETEFKTNSETEWLGVGFTFNLLPKFHIETEDSNKDSSMIEKETKISFVLGDDDVFATDEFVVDVFTDPTYGTFVFNTMAGRSQCPHEEGTQATASPLIEVVQRPVKPVLPDEPMIFKVKLTNAGVGESRFELFADNGDDSGMMVLLVAGDTLTRPQHYAIDAGEEIITTLVVERGPDGYQYPSLTIGLRVQCSVPFLSKTVTTEIWNVVSNDNTTFIEFAQPCPEVRWSGDLRRDQTFSVNAEIDQDSDSILPVTVFNPGYSVSGSFADMVNSSRLEEVLLYYRELGDIRWRRAKIFEGDVIADLNFANEGLEDTYGYTTISWPYGDSQLQDGDYELQVRTKCNDIDSAPVNFNEFREASIIGSIDRIAPKLHGLPGPHRGNLWPGEEVFFVFTEDIQCQKPYRFDLEVKVDGVLDPVTNSERVFNEENLNVFCERNKVAFAFDEADLEDLMGKTVHASLGGIKDTVGNEMGIPVTFSIVHADLDLDATSVSFDVVLEQSCTNPLGDDVKAAVQNEITDLLEVENPQRVEIHKLSCNGEGTEITADVSLLSNESTSPPPEATSPPVVNRTGDETGTRGRDDVRVDQTGNETATRWLLDGEYSPHAIHLYRHLVGVVNTSLGVEKMNNSIREIVGLKFTLGHYDQLRQEEDKSEPVLYGSKSGESTNFQFHSNAIVTRLLDAIQQMQTEQGEVRVKVAEMQSEHVEMLAKVDAKIEEMHMELAEMHMEAENGKQTDFQLHSNEMMTRVLDTMQQIQNEQAKMHTKLVCMCFAVLAVVIMLFLVYGYSKSGFIGMSQQSLPP